MANKKPITAILFNGAGRFDEIEIDRKDADAWPDGLQRLLGSMVTRDLADSARAFTRPFHVLVNERGMLSQPPTAIVVDLDSPTGTNALFGSALFFRHAGGNLASVKSGDIELVRALPWWLRFDRLERRPTIPNAHALAASGIPFDPQISLVLTDPRRQQEVFVNALLARFEYEVIAINVGQAFGNATQVEVMLKPESVRDARRFIQSAFDDDGALTGPWSKV